jgi:hypothetical protein
MTRLPVLALLCLLTLTTTVSAQTTAPRDLAATRLAASASTTARFTLGLSLDSGSSYVTSATTADNLRIIGGIQPEAAQAGQTADIYVVANLAGSYFMRNSSGAFVPWTGAVPALVPFRTGVTLTSNLSVDFITGKIPLTGTFSLFLGYKGADGVLIYTPVPHQISISAPVVTPPTPTPDPTPVTPTIREQATAAFSTNISRIVQTNPACVACHFAGGVAGGTALRFVFTSNSNHLALNFTQFENMVRSRGRNYILTTVLGGNEHRNAGAGGNQFVGSSNNQDYKNLDSFLQLLEQL